MQTGKIYRHGANCDGTKTGIHLYEDMQDGTLWCRMCGIFVEDEDAVRKIIGVYHGKKN